MPCNYGQLIELNYQIVFIVLRGRVSRTEGDIGTLNGQVPGNFIFGLSYTIQLFTFYYKFDLRLTTMGNKLN